mgnify:CR=1 FL=1
MLKGGNGGSIKIGVLGIDHRHIYGMVQGMLKTGAVLKSCWFDERSKVTDGFEKRFPDAKFVERSAELIEDSEINLVLIAAKPHLRAELAVRSMNCGKDVLVDKPGCVNKIQLDTLAQTINKTGRIWAIDFSERFEVPAAVYALDLVRKGAIGTVVQVLGLGPHRMNLKTRPDWFFNPDKSGSILVDIGSHQIDQFLAYAGVVDAKVAYASTGNYANATSQDLSDFGEMVLRSGKAHGYIRLDWYTPDGLPNWGDGRLFLLGTDGFIELRKYVDLAGRAGTDHLFISDKKETRYVNCQSYPTPFFSDFVEDLLNRTEKAVSQSHTLTVMRIALEAEKLALESSLSK